LLCVTICSPGTEGTFVVQVPKTASVGAVKEAVSKTFVLVLGPDIDVDTIRLFVAGREDPLSDAAAIAERMAQEGAAEGYPCSCRSARARPAGWWTPTSAGGTALQ
jgi:hypothetical protein